MAFFNHVFVKIFTKVFLADIEDVNNYSNYSNNNKSKPNLNQIKNRKACQCVKFISA